MARDYISIVGSSTVYPFATVVAERFGKVTDFKTPKIESTGSGGGLKLFCSGIGVDTPDITNSSRRIKSSEFEMCQQNGVTDVVEVLIGFDGIAVANSVDAPTVRHDHKRDYTLHWLPKYLTQTEATRLLKIHTRLGTTSMRICRRLKLKSWALLQHQGLATHLLNLRWKVAVTRSALSKT